MAERIITQTTVNERVADVMDLYLFSELSLCQHSIAAQFGGPVPLNGITIMKLRNKKWLQPVKFVLHDSLDTQEPLHRTYQFSKHAISDAETVFTGVMHNIDEAQVSLFQRTIDAKLAIKSEATPYSASHASYIGGITLLAKDVDLTQYGTWLPGEAGWRALVDVQVHTVG